MYDKLCVISNKHILDFKKIDTYNLVPHVAFVVSSHMLELVRVESRSVVRGIIHHLR